VATIMSRLATLKTTAWESGAQRGTEGMADPVVMGNAAEPSACATHSSSFPPRSERKQIREPSGEYCGEAFCPGDAISRFQRVAGSFPPFRSNRQIVRSLRRTL
jgi:hypothetical protein